MIYQVLARKWRPKDFATFIGQEHVVRALTHAINGGRLHHAYLFTGTRGVGKTTLSRILAKALNCETGVTATPCGMCRACHEIDEGRFVDYMEMDAASNRGVSEMSALLERAIYAPIGARFKVYMIDEVHMLTNHAFNAMLKTLEEPPLHIKFVLATTDPQKIPVTVLSRCLQFNLKQMPAALIVSHLEHILIEEQVAFELQALRLLARAAAGSMRDALSLTDQAIAYSANQITEKAVCGMLGALDQSYLIRLIDALVTGDSASMLAIANEISIRSLSFSIVLQDLISLFHRIAWAQFVPASVLDEWPEAKDLRRFANELSPEAVQLYYQISAIGRSELGLAPDEYAGFTMTLLRMLAFKPTATSASNNLDQSTTLSSSVAVNAASYISSKSWPLQQMMLTPSWGNGTNFMVSDGSTKTSTAAVLNTTSTSSAANVLSSTSPIAKHSAVSMPMQRATQEVIVVASPAPPSFADDENVVLLSTNRAVPYQVAEDTSPTQPWNKVSPINYLSVMKDDICFASSDNISDIDDHGMPILDNKLNYAGSTSAALIIKSVVDTSQPRSSIPLDAIGFSGDWLALIAELPLKGISYQLALHAKLTSLIGTTLKLSVPVLPYVEVCHVSQLKAALTERFDKAIEVHIEIDPILRTTRAINATTHAQRQREAESEIATDPFVQKLIQEFSASIVPNSIQPLLKGSSDTAGDIQVNG